MHLVLELTVLSRSVVLAQAQWPFAAVGSSAGDVATNSPAVI